jgi:chromate transporter
MREASRISSNPAVAGRLDGAMGIYWLIFISFFRVGLFGYGTGPAMLPLIQKEVVDNYGWLTREEFTDALAMANTLPGPISTKMALAIGLEVGGPLGAATALVAILLPSSVLIIFLAILYHRYRNVPSVQGIIRGVRPVVVALLMVVVANLAPRSVLTWDTFLIAFVTFLVVFYFKVHPILTIVVAAVIGYWFYK